MEETASLLSDSQTELDREASEGLPLLSPSLLNQLMAGFERSCHGIKANFDFQNMSLTLRGANSGKVILKGVSGRITSGRVTAILGPSGAGKTTFLNVLMGKISSSVGTAGGVLKINGRVRSTHHYKKALGYVPQDDIMLRELTVRENIQFSARVRLPPTWTREQVESHVDAVIGALGLQEVQHSVVGDSTNRGISGGQRKRVNIALELAACPVALFLVGFFSLSRSPTF